MKKDRNNKFAGGRDSGDRRDFGQRDGGRPQMHQATCAECGKQCEVPFKPTGDKPVYCNDCFKRQDNAGPRRSGGRDFGSRPSFSRDKQMYPATCDKCGKRCEVPFRPTEGKPVYCEQCFVKPAGDRNTGARGTDQLAMISSKLDKIINALIEAKIIKLPKAEKPASLDRLASQAKQAPKEEKIAPKKPEAKKSPAPKKATKKKK